MLSAGPSGITVQLVLHGFYKEDTVVNGITYQRIRVPEVYGHTPDVGKPELPIIGKIFAMNPTSGVTPSIVTKEEVIFRGYRIFPTQPPETDSVDYVFPQEKSFEMDTVIYQLDEFYPGKFVETGPPGIFTSIRVFNGIIFPFQHNPVTTELKVCKEITINFEFSGIDPRNQLPGYPSYYFLPEEENSYHGIVGYEGVVPSPPRWGGAVPLELVSRAGYLIIAADEYYENYYDELSDFIFWKQKQGYIVGMKKLSDIVGAYDENDKQQIKNFISSALYNPSLYAWDIPSNVDPGFVHLFYVLFIGDAPVIGPRKNPYKQIGSDELIPTYDGYTDYPDPTPGDTSSYITWSDFWYQLVRGDDEFYADVRLGRWCPREIWYGDVETFLEKTYAYERTPPDNWKTNDVGLVAWYNPLRDPTDTYIKNKEEIREGCLFLFNYPYHTLYGDEARNSDIIDVLEDTGGIGILNYRGHGLWTEWAIWNLANESWTTQDIWSLENDNWCPLVFNICCSNGCIVADDEDTHQPVEVMVEAWTRAKRKVYAEERIIGGTGALGASRPSERYRNHIFDHSLFRYLTGECLVVGWAIDRAKTEILAAFGDDDRGDTRANIRMYYWIGDPSLAHWNRTPEEPVVYHPACIPAGEDVPFTVEVYTIDGQPVPSARVCLYKPQDVHYLGLTDYNGKAHFTVHCNSPGELYVTVVRWDAHPDDPQDVVIKPYEGVCNVGAYAMGSEEEKKKFAWNFSCTYDFDVFTINYSVAEKSKVEIVIYNSAGQKIKTIVSEVKEPGEYRIIWNKKDDTGRSVSAGVYFIRMQGKGFKKTEKVMILR